MTEYTDDPDGPRRAWTSVDRRRMALAGVASLVLLGLLWFEGLTGSDDDPPGGPVGDWPVSSEAEADIPANLLRTYEEAATECPGLPWPVLAAIGKAETDHDRATATSTAGAVGPMQFLPSTWEMFGADGDGDGVADIENEVDAVYGATRLLCRSGGDLPETLQAAIFAYDRSDAYVDEVLEIARSYTEGEVEAP